ncbi:hypothetical protein GCM10011371_00740 [Novosphingobium marinum]|uniref:CENP-V/GFA domain-containing protein n=1 Tax=Novosphingobium marinum TaxID=1514948 RepID=A0A7Y9XVA0_9SPHN|nr:GFA family protein [Novosphingobium marinum]NYH93766.1 hypothetical protein [Novosphingobium marinum]GGC17153.1 hypothetical protein GCM10011371_00740 [Novosphingobium marinum]
MTTEHKEGGCLCGKVRYSVAWPPLTIVTCACANCQRHSGGAVSVIAVSKREDLDLRGDLRSYTDKGHTGGDVYREFCPNCGSAVITDTPTARANEIIFIKAGTLDETRDLEPSAHCWTGEGQKWMVYPEGAPTMIQQEDF